MVVLRPMTAAEYDGWRDAAIRSYAEDKVRVGAWPADGAVERSRVAFATLLPEGLATPGHDLRSIVTGDGAVVGTLWFGPADTLGPEVAFIWDIEVDAAHRGRGYGRAALLALEPLARSLGYTSVALHVFGDNEVARNLYRSAGYVETDVSMRKSLG
jgi:ribosomal protein S18 acetylase RimI-like enzyme